MKKENFQQRHKCKQMKVLELKHTVTEINISPDGINSTFIRQSKQAVILNTEE